MTWPVTSKMIRLVRRNREQCRSHRWRNHRHCRDRRNHLPLTSPEDLVPQKAQPAAGRACGARLDLCIQGAGCDHRLPGPLRDRERDGAQGRRGQEVCGAFREDGGRVALAEETFLRFLKAQRYESMAVFGKHAALWPIERNVFEISSQDGIRKRRAPCHVDRR